MQKLMIVVAVSAVLLQTGCISAPIASEGNGVYFVSGRSADAFSSGGQQMAKQLGRANEFCAQSGGHAVVLNGTSNDGHFGGMAFAQGARGGVFGASGPSHAASAQVEFRCEAN